MTTESRRRAYRSGRWAETLCVLLLRLRGYRIVARGFRTPVGEIDIIAGRGGRLYFIEVKERADLEAAREAVTPRQRRRISRAAALFLARNPKYADWDAQFDVMLITPGRWPVRIQNAWSVEDPA
ncbi:MAG: YraN family protein [Sphingomonadales bacterium]